MEAGTNQVSVPQHGVQVEVPQHCQGLEVAVVAAWHLAWHPGCSCLQVGVVEVAAWHLPWHLRTERSKALAYEALNHQ